MYEFTTEILGGLEVNVKYAIGEPNENSVADYAIEEFVLCSPKTGKPLHKRVYALLDAYKETGEVFGAIMDHYDEICLESKMGDL